MNNHDPFPQPHLPPTTQGARCTKGASQARRRPIRTSAAALLILAHLCGIALGQEAKPLYQNDFEKAEVGKTPADFLVLDGEFAVQQEGANKFLELPGAPLESFGVLFGPTQKDGSSVSARAYGTAKRRRDPVFALGLNGVGGYRLQVSPAKKQIELCRAEVVKTNAPYQWASGTWTRLRLQIQKTGATWKVEGKVWPDGNPEPAEWMIHFEEKEEIPPGRAGFFCSPFSGTPIRLDDIVVGRTSD